MSTAILVRVKWSDSAGCFQAQTMNAVKDRCEGSCTYSAEVAAKRAAAKLFKVEGASPEDQVSFVAACKPGASITAVGKDWTAFQFALKGTATQGELFSAEGVS